MKPAYPACESYRKLIGQQRSALALILATLSILAATGCEGGGGGVQRSVSVAVTPSSANIRVGDSFQFIATVSGSSNTTFTWAVNGISGGSPSLGSVSSTGTYTAPASLPSPATVTVTATSAASSSATASSTVTLINPAPPATSASNGGGPVLNVLDSGATVNTNIDASAAINSTVAALPASGGTVYLPAGTYAVKSAATALAINRAHVNFECAPGATIQAQTGFPADYAILDIQGSATDVLVQGCVFDGNGVSGQGFQIDGGAARISIDHVETKNQTQTGGRGNLRTGGLVQITNSYFHDVPTGFYDFVGVGGTPSLKVDNNHFDRITGNPNSIASGSSGLNYFEASGNTFTNITAGTQQVLYCYGCDKVDWEHNRFNNVTGAIHCDTCGGGNISFNTATDSRGGADFFPEVGSNITLEGNESINDSGGGITLGVGSNTQGPAQLRAQINSFDSTNGFTAGSDVSLSTDSSDKQEGTGSMVATASSSFTTGVLWHNDFAGNPPSFWNPYVSLWVKPTSGALTAGQLQLCFSVNKGLSTCDLAVDIPAIPNNAWYRLITYTPGWQGAFGGNGGSNNGFNSFGVRATTGSAGLAVKFDDLDKSCEELGYVLKSSRIINSFGLCVFAGALQGGVISDNYCENPIGGNKNAYVVENSAGVTFAGNKSSFSSGTSGTVHLLVDALTSASNVTASSDDTNAATMFSRTNGGEVFPGP